jgi:hypothetical protein
LRDFVLEELEVVFGQAGDDLSRAVGDHDVDVHDADIDALHDLRHVLLTNCGGEWKDEQQDQRNGPRAGSEHWGSPPRQSGYNRERRSQRTAGSAAETAALRDVIRRRRA